MSDITTDTFTEARTTPRLPMGNGAYYKMLAGVLVVGLGIIFGIGFTVNQGLGIFPTDGGAFVVGGLAIAFLAVTNIVLFWTLGTTVFRVRSHLEQSIMLHEIIENNYTRLQVGTEDLRREVKELRVLLSEAKRALRKYSAQDGDE